jgi:hypothetical protein
MREGGLEPPCRKAPDPKSGVSAISPPPHSGTLLEAGILREYFTLVYVLFIKEL